MEEQIETVEIVETVETVDMTETNETLETIKQELEKQNELLEAERSELEAEKQAMQEAQAKELKEQEELEQVQFKMAQEEKEATEEFQSQVLEGFETASDNTEVLTRLDSLIENSNNIIESMGDLNTIGLSLNEVGSSVGMYSLIIIPAGVIIWILWKLISMWIKPFI